MKTLRTSLRALLLAASLVACDDKPMQPPPALSTPPLSLDGALLYVPSGDATEGGALLLDVVSGKMSRKELPEGKVHAYPRTGRAGEALVLTEGASASLEGGEGRDAIPSHVLVFDGSGERKRFALAARYSSLALSDDGRFAIAYGPSGSWATADNIAIVDLEAAASEEGIPSTTVRALDGQGPSAIAFAPASGKRRLAVLVMTDAVNVIDLEHPELRDKVLPLKLPNASAALRAKKILFAGDHCFVQPDRGNDVIAVRFEDDGSERGFHAALSTLGTESTLKDVALLDQTSNPRLLTLGEGSLRVIDTLSGAGDSSATGLSYSTVHVFQGRSPFDPEPRTRALLYSPSSNQLGFVDLQPELPGTERRVDALSLSGSVQQISFAENFTLAIVAQADGKVSFVDLEERTVSLLDAGAQVTRVLLDERPGVQRAWMLTSSGSLGAVELARRTPRELLLERPATFVVPVEGDGPLVAIGQSTDGGDLLLLDARDPSRATAREIAGFLYNGFLE